MKIYISADIEGIVGATIREDVFAGNDGYEELRSRMTAHVAAACEGALEAGAEEILVRDAHGSGRNLFANDLPHPTRLLRGWAPDPMMMVQGIDESFDAVMMIGYHAPAGSGGNPLAHTMSGSRIDLMEVDGQPVGEFELYAWAAAMVGVPVALVSGDRELCEGVANLCPAITTVPVLEGHGASTLSLHPAEAADRLRLSAKQALRGDLAAGVLTAPEKPVLRIRFKENAQAMKAGYYPGAERQDGRTVEVRTSRYTDLLSAVMFLSGV